MNKKFYFVLPGVYVCIRELIILLFSSFHNFQRVVMEAALKETNSHLERLEKEQLALKEIVHRLTIRNNELEDKIHLISTYLFPKNEETGADLQVDAAEQTVPDASDVDSIDNYHDEMDIIETPDQGVLELNNDTTNEGHTLQLRGIECN